MYTKPQPVGERLIVRILGDGATCTGRGRRSRRGEVVAVGDWGRDESGRDPLGVVEGDEVLYDENAGYQIDVEGENLVIIDVSDVLATISAKPLQNRVARTRKPDPTNAMLRQELNWSIDRLRELAK